MEYLTYEEYSNLGGTIDETEYPLINFEAQSFIDWVTFDRLKNETTIPQSVKLCVFEIIKLIQTKKALITLNSSASANDNSSVSSMSNDGVTVAYNVLSARDLVEANRVEVISLIQMYLRGVTNSLGQNVLFRGRYDNE